MCSSCLGLRIFAHTCIHTNIRSHIQTGEIIAAISKMREFQLQVLYVCMHVCVFAFKHSGVICMYACMYLCLHVNIQAFR
jgi:hypothetical protein